MHYKNDYTHCGNLLHAEDAFEIPPVTQEDYDRAQTGEVKK
ncbi:MAG: hypothetical protein M0Z52_03805 [Actinomycetota bacterium]|nr:hypothetical protein [Actinomycetota bacterium]